MAEDRIFVGGLPRDMTPRCLENAFRRFGIIHEIKIMFQRDSGRPRGYGFITFDDHRAMEAAIREMHGRELGGRVITVNRAYYRMQGGGSPPWLQGRGHGVGYGSARQDLCFKCGGVGHRARECASSNQFCSRFGVHGDCYAGERGRFKDDQFDEGRYGDEHVDGGRYHSRDSKNGKSDRSVNDKNGGSDYSPENGHEIPLLKFRCQNLKIQVSLLPKKGK